LFIIDPLLPAIGARELSANLPFIVTALAHFCDVQPADLQNQFVAVITVFSAYEQ
jgi:hypothetical protein